MIIDYVSLGHHSLSIDLYVKYCFIILITLSSVYFNLVSNTFF